MKIIQIMLKFGLDSVVIMCENPAKELIKKIMTQLL